MYTELFIGPPLGNLQHTLRYLYLLLRTDTWAGPEIQLWEFFTAKSNQSQESKIQNTTLWVKLKLNSMIIYRGQSGTVFT